MTKAAPQAVKGITGHLDGYKDVFSLTEALAIAEENGATEYGISWVKDARFNDIPHAYYFFSADGKEVGHWMPAFETFQFEKGRVWHESFKAPLTIHPMKE